MFSISLPGEKPEISFVETAIVLLMSNPYLLTSDESEYRNAVQIIRNSNHPFKENLALTLEKYIKR